MLTTTQLQTLKSAILADATLNAYPNTLDGCYDLCAQKLNLVTAPSFIVWKSNVAISATGQAFNGTDLAGLTTGNQSRLQTIAQYFNEGYNPSLADVRQMFNDIFSGAGGAATRPSLLALWKRPALLIEKIFATGTGSDASPATLTYEGFISYQDVSTARNS